MCRKVGGGDQAGCRPEWLRQSPSESGNGGVDLAVVVAGDDQQRTHAAERGHQGDERAGSAEGTGQSGQLGQGFAGAEREIETVGLGRFLSEVDERLLHATAQRQRLRGAHEAGEVRRVGAARQYDVDRDRAVRARGDSRQVAELGDGSHGGGQLEAALERIDSRPKLVGRGHRAIDAVALLHLHHDLVVAGLEEFGGQSKGDPAQALRRVDRIGADDTTVHAKAKRGRLGEDRHGRHVAQPNTQRRRRLCRREEHGPSQLTVLARDAPAVERGGKVTQKRGRGRRRGNGVGLLLGERGAAPALPKPFRPRLSRVASPRGHSSRAWRRRGAPFRPTSVRWRERRRREA